MVSVLERVDCNPCIRDHYRQIMSCYTTDNNTNVLIKYIPTCCIDQMYTNLPEAQITVQACNLSYAAYVSLNWSSVCKLVLVSKTLTSIARHIKSFVLLGNKFPILETYFSDHKAIYLLLICF